MDNYWNEGYWKIMDNTWERLQKLKDDTRPEAKKILESVMATSAMVKEAMLYNSRERSAK